MYKSNCLIFWNKHILKRTLSPTIIVNIIACTNHETNISVLSVITDLKVVIG